MKIIATLLCFIGTTWAASVTCPNTGTFTDAPPFDGFPLPYCENLVQPTYSMYTRSNPNVGQNLDRNTVPANFNPSRTTFFIVHGWENNGDFPWLTDMKNAFLNRQDANVVIVDWGGEYGAQNLQYRESASTTRVVGADLGDAVNNLIQNAGGSKSLMWCAGHSLGAHVCGFTGRRHNQLGKITGMDPAGPDFANNNDRQIGLWTDCATFVSTMNTDFRYGSTPLSLGHQNHYPNGGQNQPGCSTETCSHNISYQYMIQSIISDCFVSTQKCSDTTNLPGSCSFCGSNCAYMGYASSSSDANGDYYLETQAAEPYCLG